MSCVKNKVVNYLALDIDGVLNSSETMAKTRELINKYGDIYENDEKYIEVGIRWLFREGSDGTMHATDHVDVFKLNSLKAICDQHDVKVIGISSWFTGNRDLNELSKWLGLNVIAGGFSGSSQGRIHQVAEYLSEHEDLNNTDVNLVYLDDDCQFDSTSKLGYKSLNAEALRLLTGKVNTLFVFTEGKSGASTKQFERIRQFYLAFSDKHEEKVSKLTSFRPKLNVVPMFSVKDPLGSGEVKNKVEKTKEDLSEDTTGFLITYEPNWGAGKLSIGKEELKYMGFKLGHKSKFRLVKKDAEVIMEGILVEISGTDYDHGHEYPWTGLDFRLTKYISGDMNLAMEAANRELRNIIESKIKVFKLKE